MAWKQYWLKAQDPGAVAREAAVPAAVREAVEDRVVLAAVESLGAVAVQAVAAAQAVVAARVGEVPVAVLEVVQDRVVLAVVVRE